MKSLLCLKNKKIFQLRRSEKIYLNWINFYCSIVLSTDSSKLAKAEIKITELYMLVTVCTELLRYLSSTELMPMGEIDGLFKFWGIHALL